MRHLSPSALYALKQSVPAVVMRFYLTYEGPLSPTGNRPRPDEVAAIRQQIQPQLKRLWEVDESLRSLRHSARVPEPNASFTPLLTMLPHIPDIIDPGMVEPGFIDLVAPIERGGKRFLPIVRHNLHLNCELQILFLRTGSHGELLSKAGELDNRIKTLIDALRMPEADMVSRHEYPDDPTYVLMENDTLVWSFNVDTGRLLLPKGHDENEVHLVIEVIVRVLRVEDYNMPLISN